jgi:hypothetical protein
MNCNKCGNTNFDEKGNCVTCARGSSGTGAPPQQDVWGELLGMAAVLGACWLGGKLLKSGLGSPIGSVASAPTGLPAEFQQIESRLCTDVPGQPDASQAMRLQREMAQREHNAELGRMWIEHARTMNKINLGFK